MKSCSRQDTDSAQLQLRGIRHWKVILVDAIQETRCIKVKRCPLISCPVTAKITTISWLQCAGVSRNPHSPYLNLMGWVYRASLRNKRPFFPEACLWQPHKIQIGGVGVIPFMLSCFQDGRFFRSDRNRDYLTCNFSLHQFVASVDAAWYHALHVTQLERVHARIDVHTCASIHLTTPPFLLPFSAQVVPM